MSKPFTFYVQGSRLMEANGGYEIFGKGYKKIDGPYAGQWAKATSQYLVNHLCQYGGFLRFSGSEADAEIQLCEANRYDILKRIHFYDFLDDISPEPWCSLDGIEKSLAKEASISIWESIRPYFSGLEGFGLIEEANVKLDILEACEMLERKVMERS